MLRILATALALAAATAAAAEERVALGELRLDRLALRATPPGAPVAGGFLRIENRGAADDVLLAAAVDAGVAGRVELHEMVMDGDVMRMSEVAGGIPVPAGGTVALRPGGLHLMLMDLAAPLAEGDVHAVTLTFRDAGTVEAMVPVLGLGDLRALFAEEDGHGGDGGHGGHAGHGDG